MKINSEECATLFNHLILSAKKSIFRKADDRTSYLLQRLWDNSHYSFKREICWSVEVRIRMEIWDVEIEDQYIELSPKSPLDLFLSKTFESIEDTNEVELSEDDKNDLLPDLMEHYSEKYASIEEDINSIIIETERKVDEEMKHIKDLSSKLKPQDN